MTKFAYILSIFFFLIILHSDIFPADLEMQITTIFEDYHKRGHWLPLRIAVYNNGENLVGNISATVYNDTNNEQTYITPISVLRNSEREKCLYIRPDEIGHSISIKLVDSDNRSILEKEATFNVIADESRLIAIVDQDRQSDIDNAIKQIDQSQKTYVVNAIAEKLPDKWIGYDPVDAVILGSFSSDSMSEDQRQALIDWLYGGGILVVSGGSDSQNLIGSFIESALPAKIKGTKIVRSIPSISERFDYGLSDTPTIVALSEPVGDGKIIIAEEDGLPIMSEKRLGMGRIIFLGYDYNDPIFKSWKGSSELWALILGSAQKRIAPRYESIFRLISSSRQFGLPSYKIIGIFLLSYVLCISIIGYVLFKRKNTIVWFAVGLIAVIFIAGAFGFNYATREKLSIVSDFSVVNVNQDDQRAMIQSFFGPFSSTKTELKMTFSLANAVCVENPVSKDDGTYLGGSFTLEQDDIPKIIIKNTKSLRTRMFYGELYANLNGGVSVSNLNDRQIEIANNTPFDIKDCCLFWGSRYVKIGTVSSNNQYRFSLNQDFSGNVFDNYSVEDEGKSKFLDFVRPSLPDNIDNVLIGWIDGSALEKLAGMEIDRGYKSLGKILVVASY